MLTNVHTTALAGSNVQTIAANGTLTMAESQLETLLGFTPTSSQLHLNIVVTHTGGAAPPVTVAQSIRNVSLGGEINMAQVCAVNAASASVVNPAPVSTTPVAYCGTFRPPAPYNVILYYFTISVASNGRVRANAIANYQGAIDGETYTGTLSGSNFTMTGTYTGTVYTGTIQNGSATAVGTNVYGAVTISATQAACN